MSDHLVSVVVPLYNEGKNVETLVSHLKQFQAFHELIFIDASTDKDSIALIANNFKGDSLGSKIKIEPSVVASRSKQMNQGAKLSTGTVILFLHCDTKLPKNAVPLIEAEIENGFLWGRFDVKLGSKGMIFRIIEKMIGLRSRLRKLATGDQAIFVTADLFQAVDGFPEIPLMEDIALSKSLKSYSRPALIKQPVITSARRWENRGTIKTIGLMWWLRFLYWVGVAPQKLAVLYGHER